MLPPLDPVLLYLDPGTGSWIFQAVVAALVSSAVFLKYQGRRLLGMFSRKTDEDSDAPAP